MNVNVIVLGCGKIGAVIGKEFKRIVPGSKVTMTDINEARAKKAASSIPGAAWATIDTSNYPGLLKKIEGHDMVIGALPGDYGYAALRAAVESGVDMVDVSFTPENPTQLDQAVKEKGATLIPDCGVAPGLSNLLVGYAASRLDTVEAAHVMVGGIPEKPVPPLGYTITWSADGLIDEYVRDVSIIEDGETVKVPALSGLEEIQFPGVGTLEAFYTDGLRTLAASLPGVSSMWEKTLRYPGHVEKVQLLRELGFFSEEPVKVRGGEVQPKQVTARLFERSLWMPEVGDLLAMQISVTGESKGKEAGYVFRVLDRYDHKGNVSAMARTTGYTAAIVAGMLADGMVEGPGVVTPESLGMTPGVAGKLLSELKARGIIVEEQSLHSTPR
ncbi:saccharopine dehydrogenase family protein [Candidatus Bathyarchaeota archaeon]|nr:saccharopine dehydrogenase family protein [Candidatus Bathyarchaeota archaeon]